MSEVSGWSLCVMVNLFRLLSLGSMSRFDVQIRCHHFYFLSSQFYFRFIIEKIKQYLRQTKKADKIPETHNVKIRDNA